MRYLVLSIFILLIFTFTNCDLGGGLSISKEDLYRNWELVDISRGEYDDSAYPFNLNATEVAMLEQGAMFALFTDGQMTELVLGSFQQCDWEWEEENKQIIRHYPDGDYGMKVLQYELRNEIPYLTINSDNRNLTYRGSYQRSDKPKSDPFHPANNQWRTYPHQPESEKQLKERLLNMVQHYIFILKNAMKDKESNVVSFAMSESIIRIYNGGIGVCSRDEIPPSWSATYHNSEQAIQAHEFFREYLRSHKYEGGSSGRWVTDDHNLLLSLYKYIKADINKL